MIAKLLIHPGLESRLEAIDKALSEAQLKKGHPDVLWLTDEERLGVEAAKKVRQHLSLKPYSAKGRAVIIESTHQMTDEAQNSLLKTLEEPPVESIILLGADSEKDILPTVLSRVQRVNLEKPQVQNGEQNSPEIEKLLKSTIGERFEYIEKLEDKEAFFNTLLAFFHQKLKSDPKYASFVKELIKAEGWKESNGNIRAILEYLMLGIP